MKLSYNKLLVAAVIITVVTLGLLLAGCTGNGTNVPTSFWPKFVEQKDVVKKSTNKEYIIEKIMQSQQNATDMRSALYLTHHGYLLNSIANLEIKFRQKTYMLNDVCYKPHFEIFQQPESLENKKLPHYLQRLLLEIQRLSPCLIITPLNCFYDSYRIHSQISKWNTNTDFLNRRLRNSYIDSLEENEERPYVKSNYGPELIKKWAQHMIQLSSKDSSSFSRNSLYEKIKLWLSSIEPRRKVCADPIRSCDDTLDAENYFNICTVMQTINDYDERRKQKLKFEFENGDDEFTTQLDCVEDKEKFIEWMQERELRGILKTFAPEFDMPDHQKMVNQRCDGIYHDQNSSGIEFFDGARTFGNETANFDSMKAEIAFLTPEMLLSAMRQTDYVNGFESIWTIERARELLDEFKSALREEVEKFNENRSSKKIGVTTRIINEFDDKDAETSSLDSTIHFLLIFRAILVITFSVLVWSANPVRSIGMFIARDALTFVLFAIICKSNGIIQLDSDIICYIALLTTVNLFLTTRMSFCTHRLARCVQRAKNFDIPSNFSSLGAVPVDDLQDSRQIQYVLAKYTKFQTAQDTYSNEKFEKLPRNWVWISLIFAPIAGIYWYFVDQSCQKICVILLPSFIIAVAEELHAKNKFLKERQLAKRVLIEEIKEFMSRQAVDNLFAGNRVDSTREKNSRTTYESNESTNSKRERSSGRLSELSQSTYDVSKIMAYPNEMSRRIRLYAVGNFFKLMKHKTLGVIIFSTAILSILASIGVLFIPIERESVQIETRQDDLFIDIEIKNVSANWDGMNMKLKQFNEEMDSIKTLRTISNWQKSFQRFEGRINQNISHTSDLQHYFKWIDEEPINWAVTVSLTKPSRKHRLPNQFRFRFRYELDSSENETVIIDTVQKIDELLAKYSEDLSPKAVGVRYEQYHRNAVVWNLFIRRELLAAALFIALFTVITVLFAVTPTILSAVLFSFLVIGTRLEIVSIVSLFSLDHHSLYANFALLVGFIASWTPFCDLARFRRRVLYKIQTRSSPELATRRRIRVPFIAAVDIAHFFGTLLAVFTAVAVISAIVPQFNVFFIPTVILIGIQLCAMANSIALSIATTQMFENEVRHFLREELRSSTTAGQVYDLTHKPLTPPYEEPPTELEKLTRRSPECLFYGPPSRLPTKKRRQSSEEPHSDHDERAGTDDTDQPGPSDRLSPNLPLTEPETKRLKDAATSFGMKDNGHLFDDFAHRIIAGEPLDSTSKDSYKQPGDTLDDTMRRVEEDYELNQDEEEEEDVNSRGEPDEELLATEQRILAQLRFKKETNMKVEDFENSEATRELDVDDPNVPGPSNRNQYRDPPVLEDTKEHSSTMFAPFGIPAQNPIHEAIRLVIIEQPLQRYERLRAEAERHRNVLTEQPNMVEYIRINDIPGLPPHPRANQYPSHFNRAMVDYAEDRYWTERTVPLPAGVRVPPRPYDYFDIPDTTPPAENFNWTRPVDPPPIHIPQEAYDLFEERRREHFREGEEEQRNDNNPDPNLNPDQNL